MKSLVLFLLLNSIAYAHTEDLYPDRNAILTRMNYADTLETKLKHDYRQASVSLYGQELEHILILSPYCSSIKNYLLTGARKIGIVSATCRWFAGQYRLRIPKNEPEKEK